MESTKYRNHVLAARHRGDDLFEDRETAISCSWYEELVKELAFRRISYSLFETHLEVYPRVHITGKDLETSSEDTIWREVCLILLENTVGEKPLNHYNQLALFDLAKNMFKAEEDLDWMSRYYTLALFKIKDIKVA